MFAQGEELLRPYTTRVSCFSNLSNQILLINNSMASCDGTAWQGVLHTATIKSPAASLRRVINSTMVASVLPGTPETVSEPELQEFIETATVHRRGYDKPELDE